MTVTHICCCSVVFWCYILLCFDGFSGLLFAMKHFDFDLFNMRRSDLSKYWLPDKQCTDVGLGNVGVAIEMSLLIIVVLALLGLCCRKSILLLPYLILKVVLIILSIYLLVRYVLAWDHCKSMVLAGAIQMLFGFVVYSVVAGTYQIIKYDYDAVNRYP